MYLWAMPDRTEQTKALASEVRMQILDWLKAPRDTFHDQESGDPAEIGVCVTLFAKALEMSQPTVSRHLELLHRAGFVRVRRIGRWSYFSRDEDGLRDYRRWMNDNL